MRILIADDHELIRTGVRSLLTSRPDYYVCGEASDGEDVIEKARCLQPDLIVMDITMPKLNGLEATRSIRRSTPDIDVLVLSQHDSPEMMRQALRAGARGYVVKSSISDNLVVGIETIRRGELYFGAESQAVRQDAQTDISVRPQVDPRSLLADVMDASHDAIIIHSLDGVITGWNRGAERLFAYSDQEALGQNIALIVPPERRFEEAETIARLEKGERTDGLATCGIRKDGKLVNLLTTAFPVLDRAGRVTGGSRIIAGFPECNDKDYAVSQTESQLAGEAIALAKLNDWSSRLWHTRRLEDGLQEMLGAIIELLGADKGIVRLLVSGSDKLRIVAHYGFEAHSLDPFSDVTLGDATASGRALRSGKTVVIEDVERDELYAPYRTAAAMAGLRAVVAAPLIGANGRPLGVLAAHFPEVHRPTVHEMRRLDLYVRQAADFLQRSRTEEILRESEDRLKTLSESLDADVRARTRELEERNSEVLRQSEQLRELSWKLLRTEDEERRHIARELHDSAGQTLVLLELNIASVLGVIATQAPQLAGSLSETHQMVRQLTKELRTASYLLHPPLLDESGLPPALAWFIRGVTERSGLAITSRIPDDLGRLSPDLELVIFRVVQECLTNIHRHSESKRAFIELARRPGKVLLEIRDWGKGIAPRRLAEIQSGRTGVGIRGMRERLRQFAGELRIDSSAEGTAFQAIIPVVEGACAAPRAF